MSTQMSKSQLIEKIATTTELSKRDVKNVMETLTDVGHKELKKSGVFLVPGFAKFVVIKEAGDQGQEGHQPVYGEEMMFKAKPARKIVRRGRSRQRKTQSKSKGPRKGAFVRALEKRLASALCDASSAAEGGKAVPPPIVDAAGLPRPKAQGPFCGCRQPNERAPRLAAGAIRPCFSPQRSQNTASSREPEKPGFFARSRFFSWRGLMRRTSSTRSHRHRRVDV